MPGLQNSSSTLQFLGTIGTVDRGEAFPLNDTAKKLVELASHLIQTASNNMDRKENVASGGTIASMKIVNLDLSGERKSLDIQILSTYKFLDEGVRGVNGGTGKYQFKNLHVSRKMAAAILKWLRRRSKRASTYPSTYGAYGTKLKGGGRGKIEQKDLRIRKQVQGAEDYKRLAYAVSTAIKAKGIRPTKFFTNAIRDTEKIAKRKIGEGFKIDIIEVIKNTQLK